MLAHLFIYLFKGLIPVEELIAALHKWFSMGHEEIKSHLEIHKLQSHQISSTMEKLKVKDVKAFIDAKVIETLMNRHLAKGVELDAIAYSLLNAGFTQQEIDQLPGLKEASRKKKTKTSPQ